MTHIYKRLLGPTCLMIEQHVALLWIGKSNSIFY